MNLTTNQGYQLRTGLLSLSGVTLGALSLISACAISQTQSFVDTDLTITDLTISDVLANPTDGLPVTLRGKIFQKVGDNEEAYILADGVYEITLEIYEKNFNVASGSPIEVSGEIDLESENIIQHELHPEAIEIDVYQYQVITP